MMSDNDGVDDALRSAAQTLAALLTRNAQQIAIQREHRARQRQAELDRVNSRLAAERAVDGVRGPQFTIQSADPDTPRLQITKQEALDRVCWTEEDRHSFAGRTIRGSQADIGSWIGHDTEVDAAIAERYPQVMSEAQLATVRNDQLATDPNAYTITLDGQDLAITHQTALDLIGQPDLADDRALVSIREWIGRDREIDRAIAARHPELMTPLQAQIHADSEQRLTQALDLIHTTATASEGEPDLEAVRELAGGDPQIDRAIFDHFPQLLTDHGRRQQLARQLYPVEPLLTAIHHTRDRLCERSFTKQQVLDRIDDSAAMLAPGGYFDQQQHVHGVVAQTERVMFTTQRTTEFRGWIGQDPDIDQHVHDAFPGLLNDRQIARVQVLDGKPHYPEQPILQVAGHGEETPIRLTEPDAIGIIDRRATTVAYLEPGPAREQLTKEIRDMIGQTRAVDQAIDRHFPELVDPTARANLTLAGPPERESTTAEPVDTETLTAMRHAEARALYPPPAADTDRQHVQTLLDELDAAATRHRTDRPRYDGPSKTTGAAEQELRSRLGEFVGRDLETDELIHQHDPGLLNQAQLSRMRAADALLHADTEYRERNRHDTHAHHDNSDAAAQRGTADGIRAEARSASIAVGPSETDRLENLAADSDTRADEYQVSVDRDWDTAEQRETRGRMFETCGNTEAAEARKLADTAQATPPWRAVLKRFKPRRRPRRAKASIAGRQHVRTDRGR